MTTPVTTTANATAKTTGSLDLRRIAGAVCAVLLLRLVLGIVVMPISAAYPGLPLERDVSLAPGQAPLGDWLQRVFITPWQRYDVVHYLRIVEHGYRIEENTANFHPLFPLLGTLFAWLLGGNALLGLLVASTLACVALCLVLARYGERFHGPGVGPRATWLMLLLPPGCVLLFPYSESLFLTLAVATIWAMRANRWWLAGVLGGLAALTRQQGIVLALPLAWEVWIGWRQGRARWWHGAAVALIPAAYGLFIVYRALALGDLEALRQAASPTEFAHKLLVHNGGQQFVVGQRIAWPWELLIDEVRLIIARPQLHLLIDLGLGWAGVAAVAAAFPMLHASERLYCLGIVALALCYYIGDINPYMALPRHILIAFPLYIGLAKRLPGRRTLIAAELLIPANLLLAALFIAQGWIP